MTYDDWKLMSDVDDPLNVNIEPEYCVFCGSVLDFFGECDECEVE